MTAPAASYRIIVPAMGLVLGFAPAHAAESAAAPYERPLPASISTGSELSAQQVQTARWGRMIGGRWSAGVLAPGGYAAYRRPFRGFILPRYWVAPRFYIVNYGVYGLTAPAGGYGWYRYYDDAVLADQEGRVYDSVSGISWGEHEGGYQAADAGDQDWTDYDDQVLLGGEAVYADGPRETREGEYEGAWSGSYAESDDTVYQGSWSGTYVDEEGRELDGVYSGTFVGSGRFVDEDGQAVTVGGGNPPPVVVAAGPGQTQVRTIVRTAGTDYAPPPVVRERVIEERYVDAAPKGYYEDDYDYEGDHAARAEYLERCRRDNGLGGALIGGAVGAVAGNRIAGSGNRTEGTLIGAGVGAIAGAAIDVAEDRKCREARPDHRRYRVRHGSYEDAWRAYYESYYRYYYAQPMVTTTVIVQPGSSHTVVTEEEIVEYETVATAPHTKRVIRKDKRLRR